MNKVKYETKWGALLNIISNRNYSTPQIYKIFYFGYYFLTLLIIFATLFNKNYVILSILASIVFVINGRKYEDRERLITIFHNVYIFSTSSISRFYISIYLLPSKYYRICICITSSNNNIKFSNYSNDSD